MSDGNKIDRKIKRDTEFTIDAILGRMIAENHSHKSDFV